MGDRLRALWDFDDLDATQARFEAQLEEEASDAGRAEVLTQLARVDGLRGLLLEADALAGESSGARARVLLERGRVLRSAGDVAAAQPLFAEALSTALEAREDFVAVDAAHMAAVAAPDRDGAVRWTERGIQLAEGSSDEETRYWLGPLLNNVGWAHLEAGDHARALGAFERALVAREQRPQEPYAIEIARYAVGRALRALDRAAES